MKFLFLIKSMLHDWVTVYLKYTVTILATMVLSTLAMFFIATKNATESIESVFMEKWCRGTYSLWVNFDDGFDDDEWAEKFPDGSRKCDSRFMDAFVSSGLPLPHNFLDDSLEWSGLAHMYYFEINGVPISKIISPGGSFSLSGPVAFDSTQSDYMKILNQTNLKYSIIDGRDYTDEELKNHKKVLVVAEGSGFKVGDVLYTHGYDFEVIGVITWDNEINDYSLIPFWFADECMQKCEGKRNIEISKDTFASIEGYDCYISIDRLTFETPLTRAQVKTLSDITGINKQNIMLSNEKDIDAQLQQFTRTTYLECIVFGIFCMTNVLLVVWCLCEKMYPTLKIFRVYGAEDKTVIALIITALMIVTAAAAIIGGLLCPLTLQLYRQINSVYAWRFRCVATSAVALLSVNLLTAIPTAAMVVKKQPIEK